MGNKAPVKGTSKQNSKRGLQKMHISHPDIAIMTKPDLADFLRDRSVSTDDDESELLRKVIIIKDEELEEVTTNRELTSILQDIKHINIITDSTNSLPVKESLFNLYKYYVSIGVKKKYNLDTILHPTAFFLYFGFAMLEYEVGFAILTVDLLRRILGQLISGINIKGFIDTEITQIDDIFHLYRYFSFDSEIVGKEISIQIKKKYNNLNPYGKVETRATNLDVVIIGEEKLIEIIYSHVYNRDAINMKKILLDLEDYHNK